MHRRLAGAALVGAVLLSTALVLARGAPALPLCSVGQIVKTGDPALSAPSPTYVGNTITSSGGSWSSCGVSVTGFYSEWLRDGGVISGPTWVAGAPGSFTYVAQAADVGHKVTAAVRPCNSEGCYGSYAASANAIVPVAAPPPPPSPPPSPPPPPVAIPPVAVSGYVRDATGVGVFNATVQLYLDPNTDSSVTQTALATATTDPSGYYELRASADGAVAAEIAANDGWVNFEVEGAAGSTPYFVVIARHWDGAWTSADQLASGVSSDVHSDPSLNLTPLGNASVATSDWANVSGPCRYAAVEKKTLVRTEIDPTTIGELHVAKDASGTFSYGITNRADSQISIGLSSGGWHLAGFRHIANTGSLTVAVSNTTDDWARQIRARFVYGLYKHERTTIDPVTGRPVSCGTWQTKEAKLWLGNIELGADLSAKLHLCQTKFVRWALPYPPNSDFQRYSGKLQTWEGGASVNLGVGALDLSAWSGASKSVGYHYHFGAGYDQHWLCGTDSWPMNASRIFAGG